MNRPVIDFARHGSRCGGKRKQDELTGDVLIGGPVSWGPDTGPQSSWLGILHRAAVRKKYKRLIVLEEVCWPWERGLPTFVPSVHEVFHVPYPLVQLRSPLGPAQSDSEVERPQNVDCSRMSLHSCRGCQRCLSSHCTIAWHFGDQLPDRGIPDRLSCTLT
jgi:hypothetical protein